MNIIRMNDKKLIGDLHGLNFCVESGKQNIEVVDITMDINLGGLLSLRLVDTNAIVLLELDITSYTPTLMYLLANNGMAADSTTDKSDYENIKTLLPQLQGKYLVANFVDYIVETNTNGFQREVELSLDGKINVVRFFEIVPGYFKQKQTIKNASL